MHKIITPGLVKNATTLSLSLSIFACGAEEVLKLLLLILKMPLYFLPRIIKEINPKIQKRATTSIYIVLTILSLKSPSVVR